MNFHLSNNIAPNAVYSSNARSSGGELAGLPEWNLADLYPGMESSEYEADMRTSKKEAEDFEKKYAGKLADIINRNPRDLALAISEYEMIEERLGRIMSYAGLNYFSDTSAMQG